MNISFQEQTIVAQCTPIGNGALAIIRLSGKDSFLIVDLFSKLSSRKRILEVESHTVHFGYIVNSLVAKPVAIDQVMFIVMKAPRTFTGENVVEITCHNNQFIIEEIINLAIKHGACLAQNGEFARRAFLNNKIDLMQAESINELIHSNNQQSLKKSLSQLEGSFSSWIVKIEKELLHCLALSEASFEFLDDEIEFKENILVKINSVLGKIKELKLSNNDYSSIREGLRVAILGSVNAGKSSLFNYLIKKDRSIVTSIAGTTRDTIEVGVYKKDSYVTFVDTAGIRKTQNVVEQEGIKRSFLEAEKADIILLVQDGSKELSESELKFYSDLLNKFQSKIILVKNKMDQGDPTKSYVKSDVFNNESLAKLKRTRSNGSTWLTTSASCKYSNSLVLSEVEGFEQFRKKSNESFGHTLNVSAKTSTGLLQLEQTLDHKIQQILNSYDVPFVLNKRQYSLMIDLENKLYLIKDLLTESTEYEILSIHLKEALESISHLSGRNISEAAMDAIFKEFCVGK